MASASHESTPRRKTKAVLAGLFVLGALVIAGCFMFSNPSTTNGYREFYSCVLRVRELTDRIKLAQKEWPGITEAQVQAYFAQYPIGKARDTGEPCYAQYWRVPQAVSVAASDGEIGSLTMRFPLVKRGAPASAAAMDGLGTADVDVEAYVGGIPGRSLYQGLVLNADGSIHYNREVDELVRDEKAGFDLVVQRNRPDVGGRITKGVPIDRGDHLYFTGEIPWGVPISFAALDGFRVVSSFDDRVQVSYYVWPDGMPQLRQTDAALQERVRGFLVNPQKVIPINQFRER